MQTGNKAGIYYNYFGVHDKMIAPLFIFLHQCIVKHPENQKLHSVGFFHDPFLIIVNEIWYSFVFHI